MSVTIPGIVVIVIAVIGLSFLAGAVWEACRTGGSMDLRRDVRVALREYDELLSPLSTPPLREERAARGLVPVQASRPSLTLIGGDAS